MDESRVIGAVLSKTTPSEFHFIIDIEQTENRPVELGEYVGFSLFDRPAIGVVSDIERINEEIIDSLANSPASINRMRELAMEPGAEKLVATVKVQGYVEPDGRVIRPRFPPLPGTPVFRDPNEELITAMGQGQIEIGNLLANPDVPVTLNVQNLLSRHFSVLAVTGAGKSYTVAVILSEIMNNFPYASIVVIDPHADYFFFRNLFPNRTQIFTPTGADNTTRIRFKVRNFNSTQLAEFANITSKMTNLMDKFEEAYQALIQQGDDFDFNDIRRYLESVRGNEDLNSKERSFAANALRRMRFIPEEVFLDATVETDLYNSSAPCLVSPGQMTIIGTGLLPKRGKEALVNQVLRRIFNGAVALRQGLDEPRVPGPVLVVIEEAHQFAPPQNTDCKEIIAQIAAEGRKFGVGLGIISQRPGKIDENVLSQCNTQITLKITNPKDQNAIANASETMSADFMKDLPGLNVGEAIITGSAIGLPSMVSIRRIDVSRGGDDVDIIREWTEREEENYDVVSVEAEGDLEDLV
ncbi:MAG: ATP-binding protein [Methanobacteriota archaeon]|nr:MAG: ATP-binding protein [Euryarchaeota archaeon]